MTVHIAPAAAVSLFISLLIAAYVYRRTQADLIGSITAGAAIFAVLCVVISTGNGTDERPALEESPTRQSPGD